MLFRNWLLAEDIRTNIFDRIISDTIAEQAATGMRNFLYESLRFHKPGRRGDEYRRSDSDDLDDDEESSRLPESPPSEESGLRSQMQDSKDLRDSVLWIRWDAMVKRRELIQQVQKMCELHKREHPEEFEQLKSRGITESTEDDFDFSSMDDFDFSSIDDAPISPTSSSQFDIDQAYKLLERLGYIDRSKFENEMRSKTNQERRMAILELMHKATKETGNDPPADISEEEMYGVDQEKSKKIESELLPLRKKFIELQKNEPKDKKEKIEWQKTVDELKDIIKKLGEELETSKKSKVELAKKNLTDILRRVYERDYEWHASHLNTRNSYRFKGDDNKTKFGYKTFGDPDSVLSSHLEDILDHLTTRNWRKPSGEPAKLMDWGELHEKFPELGKRGTADLDSQDWIDGVSREDEPGNTKGIIAAYRSRLARTPDKEEQEQRVSISPSAAKRSSITYISEKKDIINLDINSVQAALTGKDPGLKKRKKRVYLSTPDNPYGSLEFYMNYLKMYNQYVSDRNSISPSWAAYFDDVVSGVEDSSIDFPEDVDEDGKIRKRIMEDIIQHQSRHSHILSLDPRPEKVITTLTNYKTNLLHVSKSPIVVSSDMTSDKATAGVWQSGRPSGALDRPHDLPAGVEAERNETHVLLKNAIHAALKSLVANKLSNEALAICIKWGIPDPRHNSIASGEVSDAISNLIGARGAEGKPAKAGRDIKIKCQIVKQNTTDTVLSMSQDYRNFSGISVGNDVFCTGCKKGTEVIDVEPKSKIIIVSPAIIGSEGQQLDVKFSGADCVDKLKNLSAPYPHTRDAESGAIDAPAVSALTIKDVARIFNDITGEDYSEVSIRTFIDRGLKYICTFISNYNPISSTHRRFSAPPAESDNIAQKAKESAREIAKTIPTSQMTRPPMTGKESPLMSRVKKQQPLGEELS